MKRLRVRELILLMLPVLLIGGAALARWNGWFGMFPERLATGQARLVTMTPQPLALSPRDVGSGWDWATQVAVYQAGTLPPGLPASAKNFRFMNDTKKIEVVYQQDGRWHQAPQLGNGRSRITMGQGEGKIYNAFHLRRDMQIYLRLDGLEGASQIRVRGNWIVMNAYSKEVCAGIPAVAGWDKAPINCRYDVTGPFDIKVKGPGDPFPKLTAPNEKKFEVLDGALIRIGFLQEQSVTVRVRPLFGFGKRGDVRVAIADEVLRDAKGKQIDWQLKLPGGGTGIPFQGGSIDDRLVSPDLPADQILVGVTVGSVTPKGGWNKVPMPMTLEGTISDGQSWPQPFKVKIPLFPDKLDKFTGNPPHSK